MTNTERKLDEAQYFLRQLDAHDPYFDYILSAYLNAARSTSWIMRHEFSKVKGWEGWFESCNITNEQKNLLKKINDLRISSTKRSGIKTEYYFLENLLVDEQHFSIIKEILNLPEGTELEIEILPSDEVTQKEAEEDSYRFQGMVKMNEPASGSSREFIFKLCNDYFDFLQKQVRICVDKFAL
jgi:hypothetical protein